MRMRIVGIVGVTVVLGLAGTAGAQTCNSLFLGQSDPFNAGNISACLQELSLPEACADSLAAYIVSVANTCDDAINPQSCVNSQAPFTDPACFFGGAGTVLDQPNEAATAIFGGEVIGKAIPRTLSGRSGREPPSTVEGGVSDPGSLDPIGAPSESSSRGGRALTYNSVDASLTLDFFEVGNAAEGTAYQIAAGYASVGETGAFFLNGAVTLVEPDEGDGSTAFRGKVGFRTGEDTGFGLGVYGTFDYLDVDPESVLHGGGGLFSSLRFDLDGILLSGGALVQGVVSDRDLPDDDLDYGLSIVYGGGVGVPLGDSLAVNGQIYRTTPFGRLGDEAFEELGSFTTLVVSGDFAVSPSFALNAGYRTRFEIDDYDTNAFVAGVRSFWD